MRGVPVRVELGMRDIENGVATVARRLPTVEGQGKEQIPLDKVAELLPGMLADFQAFLLARAERFREDRTAVVDGWDAFTAQVASGWARAFHCGETDCEDAIKADTAATPRVIPADAPEESGVCVKCGRPSAYGKRVIFGKAY
jgi:prolyl-tRNA synthetase